MSAEFTEHVYQEYHGKCYEPIHQREKIVRCRDCRWLDDSVAEQWDNVLAEMYGNPPLCCEAPQWSTASLMPPHEVKPNGFCSWGERKVVK